MYDFFHGLFESALEFIRSLFAWLGELLGDFFDGIKGFLINIFQPVLTLIEGVFYLLTQCFIIAILVVQIVFGLFKIVAGIMIGAYSTFMQLLDYSGSTSYYYMPDLYQGGWNMVFSFINETGLNTMALLMAVFIWLATAYAVVRLAGGER